MLERLKITFLRIELSKSRNHLYSNTLRLRLKAPALYFQPLSPLSLLLRAVCLECSFREGNPQRAPRVSEMTLYDPTAGRGGRDSLSPVATGTFWVILHRIHMCLVLHRALWGGGDTEDPYLGPPASGRMESHRHKW